MSYVSSRKKIAARDKSIARQVIEQFPIHFAEDESMLITFTEAYYEWMESTAQTQHDIYRLPEYMDVDTTPEKFLEYFREEFLPSIPESALVDKRLLIKHAKEFYRTRGTEKSFKFLFRIIYNEDVKIDYPKGDLFRTSDNEWRTRTIIKMDAFDYNISTIKSRQIHGVLSGASAIIETTQQYGAGEYQVLEAEISNIIGTFQVDEPIETRDVGLPNVLSRVLGQISKVSIIVSGENYAVSNFIPFVSTGDGIDLSLRISSVGIGGNIKGIDVVNSGVGYFSTNPVENPIIANGTGLLLSYEIGPIFTSKGYFVDDRCMTSSTKKLQDGKVYQEFSYVLKSQVASQLYRDIITRIVHPAGMAMFSQYDILTDAESTQVIKGVLFHASRPDNENYKNPDHPSSRKFFEPTIKIEPIKQTMPITVRVGSNININIKWSPSIKGDRIYRYANETIAEFGTSTLGDIMGEWW